MGHHQESVDHPDGVGGLQAAGGAPPGAGQRLHLHLMATNSLTSSISTVTKVVGLAISSLTSSNRRCTILPLSPNHIEQRLLLLTSIRTPLVKGAESLVSLMAYGALSTEY